MPWPRLYFAIGTHWFAILHLYLYIVAFTISFTCLGIVAIGYFVWGPSRCLFVARFVAKVLVVKDYEKWPRVPQNHVIYDSCLHSSNALGPLPKNVHRETSLNRPWCTHWYYNMGHEFLLVQTMYNLICVVCAGAWRISSSVQCAVDSRLWHVPLSGCVCVFAVGEHDHPSRLRIICLTYPCLSHMLIYEMGSWAFPCLVLS